MQPDLKSFLKKTALFLALFLAPLLLLEWRLRQPDNDSYALKHYLLQSTLETNEILILGNSLSWGGLIPADLSDHCINIANYNQSFYSDYKILEQYGPLSKSLHTVIIPLNLESFFAKPGARSEEYYAAIFGIEPHDGKYRAEHYSLLMIYGLWPGIRQLSGPSEIVENKGWGTSNDVYRESPELIADKLAFILSQMEGDHFDLCTGYLEKIIETCNAQGLRLVLYQHPLSKGLIRELEKDSRYARMQEYLGTLSGRQDVEYFDLRYEELFVDSLFRDINHLNMRGAGMLTQMMRGILAGRQPGQGT
ncbi:MAG: hypothetical protein RLY31_912 [Bacteroidota bacterium]|jgi:hypothetical protein